MFNFVKFTTVAILFTLPLTAFAIEVAPGSDAIKGYLPPMPVATVAPVPSSEFLPNAKEYDWQAASRMKVPETPAMTRERNLNLSWVMFGTAAAIGGVASYWLGRRRRDGTVVADGRYAERQRVLDTNRFYVSVPGPTVAEDKPRAAPAVSLADGPGSFELFLERARLLAGKSSGPDMGRC